MATYGFTIRKEEYTPLGDFISPSITRDLATYTARFPRINQSYLNEFLAKLLFVKELEAQLVIQENQQAATAALYKEATELNTELNFLKENFKDAALNTATIVDLKAALTSHNIEGALIQIESLKQYIIAHQQQLQDEGMAADFATTLQNHKTNLAAFNVQQNQYMNASKTLTDNNKAHYNELYQYITNICNKGKILFKGKVTQDEYNISKTIKKMRTAPHKPKTNN